MFLIVIQININEKERERQREREEEKEIRSISETHLIWFKRITMLMMMQHIGGGVSLPRMTLVQTKRSRCPLCGMICTNFISVGKGRKSAVKGWPTNDLQSTIRRPFESITSENKYFYSLSEWLMESIQQHSIHTLQSLEESQCFNWIQEKDVESLIEFRRS